MKIVDVKTFVMHAYRVNWVFVKIETDEGIHGIGEATLGMREHALVGAIQDIKRYLIGKDPTRIEEHWFTIYRDSYWKNGPVLMSAISGIEMAMWDILGKSLNVPVYKLLGGKMRDEVKIYANGWFAGAKSPKDFAEKAKSAVEKGIKAIKWDPFGKAYLTISNDELNTAIECVGLVREVVGPSIDLLIEAHGRFNPATAIKISRELAPFKPMFFEEPVPPDNMDALAEVKEKSPIAIAAGERAYTKYDFRELLEKRAVDYIQPDVSHAGGIMELKKICAMAEAYHIPASPHNPSGPVANAATLQLAACIPNFHIHEIMITDISWRKNISDEEIFYKDGYVKISDKPGLGVELNEEEISKHPYQPLELRHYKGTLTDIRPQSADTIYYFNGM